ncbi:MAG: hypothetical protein R3Y39_02330 [Rikenellaceae bacterium]
MKYIYLIIALFIAVVPAMADKKGGQILDEMSSAIDAIGSYEVSFEVVSGGRVVASGEYIVDRDLYKLSIADQEIYGDSKSRFTIDNRLREIIMESIDSSIPMVVANPARAFKGLSKSFDSKIVEQSDNITIALTPRKESDIIDSALLEIDTTTKLPILVRYEADGEQITVRILDLHKSSISLVSLEELVLPDGYDIIDVR